MSKTPREFARSLRKHQTDSEAKLWQELRGRRCGGYKFKRQYVVDDYVVDFVCVSAKLIVEVDGPTHDGREEYDATRTKHLSNRGYRVIRFSNTDIFDDINGVVEAIFHELNI